MTGVLKATCHSLNPQGLSFGGITTDVGPKEKGPVGAHVKDPPCPTPAEGVRLARPLRKRSASSDPCGRGPTRPTSTEEVRLTRPLRKGSGPFDPHGRGPTRPAVVAEVYSATAEHSDNLLIGFLIGRTVGRILPRWGAGLQAS